MEQPLANFGDTVKAVDQVAAALSIESADIDSRFPLQIVSTGFPALYVPLANLGTLQRVELNLTVLREVLGNVDMVYVFTSETLDQRSTVHSRAFAPFIGISEDPATGSAAGALGAYLVHHKFIENLDPAAIVIEQGFEMNRPSTIQVRVGTTGGEIRSIEVGGQAITVLEGNLRI
jgi:trans-2,3-dihydro-3-hydroxyanthranilate isomerase